MKKNKSKLIKIFVFLALVICCAFSCIGLCLNNSKNVNADVQNVEFVPITSLTYFKTNGANNLVYSNGIFHNNPNSTNYIIGVSNLVKGSVYCIKFSNIDSDLIVNRLYISSSYSSSGNSFLSLTSNYIVNDNYCFFTCGDFSTYVYFVFALNTTYKTFDFSICNIIGGSDIIYDSNGNAIINNQLFYSQENYNNSYNNGYNIGYDEGYSQGNEKYNQLLENYSKDVLPFLNWSYHLINSGANGSYNQTIDLFTQGSQQISSQTMLSEFESEFVGDILESPTFMFYANDDSLIKLSDYALSAYQVASVTFYVNSNVVYEFTNTNLNYFDSSTLETDFYYNGVAISYLNTLNVNDGYSFNVVTTQYNNGFNVGYSQGYDLGYSIGVSKFNENSYSQGYSQGYDLGVSSQQQTIDELRKEIEDGFSIFTPVTALLNTPLFYLGDSPFTLGIILMFSLGLTAVFIFLKIFK